MNEPRTRLDLAALGDSTGVGVGDLDGGYPDRLAKRLVSRGFRVGLLNLAQSGAISSDVATSQVERAVKKQPSLVLLGVGTNDLWRMVSLEKFAANLEHTGDRLESIGCRVVVANIADLSLAPVGKLIEQVMGVPRALFHDRVEAMNAILARLARRPRFALADLFGPSQAELASHPEYFSADGFHPSARGYDRWAELMWPEVERAAEQWRRERGSS